jgi:hypothetical protein
MQFSEWAVEFMLLPPFCWMLPLLAISWVRAGLKQRPFRTQLWKPYHWLVLSHLLFFAAAILLGTFCDSRTTGGGVPHNVNRFADFSLDVLSYGSFASCAFWIWPMKGFAGTPSA